MAFSRASKKNTDTGFSFDSGQQIYLDTACQTLRPTPVLDAVEEYYTSYNACGGRVKHDWGQKVDSKVLETRARVLKMLGKSSKNYICAFTLNTTHGINQVLGQLPKSIYEKVITSEIEHNSVFLPTMGLASGLGVKREVFERADDGSLIYKPEQLNNAIVVVNSSSNIDGRNLLNARKLAQDIHEKNGLLLIDGAQTMAHSRHVLEKVDFDGLFFSGHKLYAPSLGVMVIRKELIRSLEITHIGGGMVQDVSKDGYTLIEEDLESRLEAGLQDFAGIIGLNAAIEWQEKYRHENMTAIEHIDHLSTELFEKLSHNDSITLINKLPSPVLSFYCDKIDAHKLAIYLSVQGIMARSGYFCCHYYLKEKKQYPPLLRLSLGLHNTDEQIDRTDTTLTKILASI